MSLAEAPKPKVVYPVAGNPRIFVAERGVGLPSDIPQADSVDGPLVIKPVDLFPVPVDLNAGPTVDKITISTTPVVHEGRPLRLPEPLPGSEPRAEQSGTREALSIAARSLHRWMVNGRR